MAKWSDNLAKSAVDAIQAPLESSAEAKTEVTLLFSGRGYFDKQLNVPLHEHPSWQADLFLEGGCVACGVGGWKSALSTGDAVFIAPDTRHGFDYQRPGVKFLTCWFVLKNLPSIERIAVLKSSPASQGLIRALYELQPTAGTVPSGRMASAIESCLEALLALFPCGDDGVSGIFPANLAGMAMRWVQRCGGGRVAIKEMASAFNCSRSHLSHAFKDEYGFGLKKFIDSKRAEILEKMSRQTMLSPAKLAEHLGFRDSAELSRFCKRRLGSSPRNLR